MAVDDWKLCYEVFASVFIEHKIFFGSGPCKEVNIDLLLVFVRQRDFVIVGYTRIGLGLFVLISLLIMVFLVVNRIVKRETINIAIDTSSDDFSVVVGDGDVLDVIRERKELNEVKGTLRVS